MRWSDPRFFKESFISIIFTFLPKRILPLPSYIKYINKKFSSNWTNENLLLPVGGRR